MSSQLSAHAITAHTAMTRISVSRCSTLPAHRGSASAEKGSTSFSADIAILPSSIKGEPAQPVSPSEPARPFHALPLGLVRSPEVWSFSVRPCRTMVLGASVHRISPAAVNGLLRLPLWLARISATQELHGSAHEERTSGRRHQPPLLFSTEGWPAPPRRPP